MKIIENIKKVQLQRGNKTIFRSEVDYKTNLKMYNFRGFELVENNKNQNPEIKKENIIKLNKSKPKKKLWTNI